MSHDLCLCASNGAEFELAGNPDADDLGRGVVFGGNPGSVVTWYEGYCKSLGWDSAQWEGWGLSSSSDTEVWTSAPEWADPDPVNRHIALVNAFLAFAPGARFGAS